MNAFADDKLNVAKMVISVIDKVENISFYHSTYLYKQFLIFPQCFQKASFEDASKGVIVWKWVKGSLSIFCRAPVAFIRRNTVPVGHFCLQLQYRLLLRSRIYFTTIIAGLLSVFGFIRRDGIDQLY